MALTPKDIAELLKMRALGFNQAEIAEASEFGVTAVPTFIINGQWSVPGAQDVEMFERIIERILERA